jgi:hypothetical protein
MWLLSHHVISPEITVVIVTDHSRENFVSHYIRMVNQHDVLYFISFCYHACKCFGLNLSPSSVGQLYNMAMVIDLLCSAVKWKLFAVTIDTYKTNNQSENNLLSK